MTAGADSPVCACPIPGPRREVRARRRDCVCRDVYRVLRRGRDATGSICSRARAVDVASVPAASGVHRASARGAHQRVTVHTRTEVEHMV